MDGEERVFYVQVLSEATEVAEVGSPSAESHGRLSRPKCQGNAKEMPERLV